MTGMEVRNYEQRTRYMPKWRFLVLLIFGDEMGLCLGDLLVECDPGVNVSILCFGLLVCSWQ